MSGPSCYPKPGSLTSAWWEDGDTLHSRTGPVAVMATSRHTHSISEAKALELLRSTWGDAVEIDRIGTWNSVTQADIEHGTAPGEADVGGWAEDCMGQAWVRVAYPALDDDYEPRRVRPQEATE